MTNLVLRSAPLKSGRALERQMQLHGIAAHQDIAGAADHARIEVARAHEIEEGCFGVDGRDDSFGCKRFTVFQGDACGLVICDGD